MYNKRYHPLSSADKWRHNLAISIYTAEEFRSYYATKHPPLQPSNLAQHQCLRGCDMRSDLPSATLAMKDKDCHWIYAYYPATNYPVFVGLVTPEITKLDTFFKFKKVLSIYYMNTLTPQVCPYETMRYIIDHALSFFEQPSLKFYVPKRRGFLQAFNYSRGYDICSAAVYQKEVFEYPIFAKGQVALDTWIRISYGTRNSALSDDEECDDTEGFCAIPGDDVPPVDTRQ